MLYGGDPRNGVGASDLIDPNAWAYVSVWSRHFYSSGKRRAVMEIASATVSSPRARTSRASCPVSSSEAARRLQRMRLGAPPTWNEPAALADVLTTSSMGFSQAAVAVVST
jgi:hypothetical protein